MTPDIKSALIQLLGGAIFGGLIAYFAFALQRKRKVLEYVIFAMPLLRFTPERQRSLSLAVDEYVLTGEGKPNGVLVPINNAFGFEVEILNMGNQEVVEPSIEVRLNEAAKIIEYETKPTSEPAYDISINRESLYPNVIRIVPPYINSRERILIRLISTDNADLECHVKIRGLGIISRPYRNFRKFLTFAIPLVAPVTSVFVVSKAFPSFFSSLGVIRERVTQQEQVTKESYPVWLFVAFLVFCFGPGVIALINLVRHPMPTRTQSSTDSSKEAHWDLDKKRAK